MLSSSYISKIYGVGGKEKGGPVLTLQHKALWRAHIDKKDPFSYYRLRTA